MQTTKSDKDLSFNNQKQLKEVNNNFKKPWWQDSVVLFIRLSGWIGVPIILAALVGRSLDQRFNTEPWIFLLATALAFFVSMLGLFKEVVEAYQKISQEDKEDKNKANNKKNNN